jgi:hypothetical protein
MTYAGSTRFSLIRLTAAAALLGAVWGAAPVPAGAQGTPQQQQACQGDAQRLCGEFIPDVAKITACMNHKRSQLSPACRAATTVPSHGHGHPTHHHHHT